MSIGDTDSLSQDDGNGKLFSGFLAWFSDTVLPDSKEIWENNGGEIVGRIEEADYGFCDGQVTEDTYKSFVRAGEGVCLLYYTTWITKSLQEKHKIDISDYFNIPREILEESKIFDDQEKYEKLLEEKNRRNELEFQRFEKERTAKEKGSHSRTRSSSSTLNPDVLPVSEERMPSSSIKKKQKEDTVPNSSDHTSRQQRPKRQSKQINYGEESSDSFSESMYSSDTETVLSEMTNKQSTSKRNQTKRYEVESEGTVRKSVSGEKSKRLGDDLIEPTPNLHRGKKNISKSTLNNTVADTSNKTENHSKKQSKRRSSSNVKKGAEVELVEDSEIEADKTVKVKVTGKAKGTSASDRINLDKKKGTSSFKPGLIGKSHIDPGSGSVSGETVNYSQEDEDVVYESDHENVNTLKIKKNFKLSSDKDAQQEESGDAQISESGRQSASNIDLCRETVTKKRKSSGDSENEHGPERGLSNTKRKKLYSSSSGSQLPDVDVNIEVIPETPQVVKRVATQTRSPEDIRQILATSDKKSEDLSNRLLRNTEARGLDSSPALSNKEVRKVRRDTMVKHAKLLEHKRLGQKPVDDYMVGSKSGLVHIDELDVPALPLQDFIVNKHGCRVKFA